MFKSGDILICIDASNLPTGINLIEGRKYVCYEVVDAPCGCQGVDIGLTMREHNTVCDVHNCKYNVGLTNIRWARSSRFRKEEPEYRVVKIEVEERELIYN